MDERSTAHIFKHNQNRPVDGFENLHPTQKHHLGNFSEEWNWSDAAAMGKGTSKRPHLEWSALRTVPSTHCMALLLKSARPEL
jgi:hypothetical protein